ncbi:MAG: alanine dehydrogenase [Acidobacteriota bacterium]
MLFGVPKETAGKGPFEEKRVSVSPAGVRELVEAGAEVIVESGAGADAGFVDEAYRKVGAQVVYTQEEVFGRADTIVKIARPSDREIELTRQGASVLAFWHMAVAFDQLKEPVEQKGITALGYEVIQEADGAIPILRVSSEIAGCLAPQIAGHLLQSDAGGIGILLPGAPGIPPADVVIVDRPSRGAPEIPNRMDRNPFDRGKRSMRVNLKSAAGVAVVKRMIETSPVVVTREMVKEMRPGTVIIDFSFDQGGCVETTRLQGPSGGLFVREDVLHFAVANCPSLVSRSATHALTHVLLPYLLRLQEQGLEGTLRQRGPLASGCYAYHGQWVRNGLVDNTKDLDSLVREG